MADKFKPHMMYDPKTGKGQKAKKMADQVRMDKKGYTHKKPKKGKKGMKYSQGGFLNQYD